MEWVSETKGEYHFIPWLFEVAKILEFSISRCNRECEMWKITGCDGCLIVSSTTTWRIHFAERREKRVFSPSRTHANKRIFNVYRINISTKMKQISANTKTKKHNFCCRETVEHYFLVQSTELIFWTNIESSISVAQVAYLCAEMLIKSVHSVTVSNVNIICANRFSNSEPCTLKGLICKT